MADCFQVSYGEMNSHRTFNAFCDPSPCDWVVNFKFSQTLGDPHQIFTIHCMSVLVEEMDELENDTRIG